MKKDKKNAIAGIGNCAGSLIQGIHYYEKQKSDDAIRLMHWEIGGFKPSDIEVVAAFDIDKREVGKDLNEAVFSEPNCTTVFCPDIFASGVTVQMGRIFDDFSEHMRDYDETYTFRPAWEYRFFEYA
jgi:myo-inositol-1-phosphate synthase